MIARSGGMERFYADILQSQRRTAAAKPSLYAFAVHQLRHSCRPMSGTQGDG